MTLDFFRILQHYIIEISIPLGLGLLLSGVIHEFVSQSWVKEHLSKNGISPLLYATISGIILPLCCFGALPIAIGFRKKGVGLGPILAFLVATPVTSITAILVSLRFLGLGFTLYLCLSVVLISLVIGLIGNRISFELKKDEEELCPHCAEGKDTNHCCHKKRLKSRIISILSFGFIDILKEIGLFLFLGLVIASLVTTFVPLGSLIKTHLGGELGYLFSLIFGLLMYICATASVPLVHALINQGMDIGAGLVLLIVGPITSYSTLLVIGREFGVKVLSLYLGVICLGALILGYVFSLL